MKKSITTTGRIIFALPMLAFGLMHFTSAAMMAQYVVPKWMPAPEILVYFTGALLIISAIAISMNKFAHYAGLALAIFMLVLVATVQIPGTMNTDPMMAQMAMSGMLKDTAILGAGLMIFGFYQPKNV